MVRKLMDSLFKDVIETKISQSVASIDFKKEGYDWILWSIEFCEDVTEKCRQE